MLLSTSEKNSLQDAQNDFLEDYPDIEKEEKGEEDEEEDVKEVQKREEEIIEEISEDLEDKKEVSFDNASSKANEEKKFVSSKIFKILSEYNFTKNIEKTIIKLEKLRRKYPKNIKLNLTLSKMFQKKGKLKTAVKILEPLIIEEYDKTKIEALSEEVQKCQYDLYYNLGLLKKNLFSKTKDSSFLENALTCFQQCNLFRPDKKGGLVLLASLYDNLKIFENSHKIWSDLIDTNPHENLFVSRYIISLKESQQKKKLFEFLKAMDKRKTRCAIVYRELSKLVKKKKEKKECNRKMDFYSFIPKICTTLSYNEYSYSIMTKVKRRDKKTVTALENLMMAESLSSSEWIVAVLYNLAALSKEDDREMDKVIITTLMEEVHGRINEKNLLKFLSLFLTTFHRVLTQKLIYVFVKNKKLLKKNEAAYKMFFEQLIRFYLQKNDEINVSAAFLHLKDPRITPYLINSVKYGSPRIKKKATLILPGFASEKNLEVEETLMIEYGRHRLKEEVKLYLECALFKIRKEKTFLTIVKRMIKQKKKIPDDVTLFLDKCEGVPNDLKAHWKRGSKRKNKDACKQM